MIFMFSVQKFRHVVNVISPYSFNIFGGVAHSNDALVDICVKYQANF